MAILYQTVSASVLTHVFMVWIHDNDDIFRYYVFCTFFLQMTLAYVQTICKKQYKICCCKQDTMYKDMVYGLWSYMCWWLILVHYSCSHTQQQFFIASLLLQQILWLTWFLQGIRYAMQACVPYICIY